MGKKEFSLYLIQTYINKNKSPDFLYEDKDIFTYILEENVINIDYNYNTMSIEKNGEETFFTFDKEGKINGTKSFVGNCAITENYKHGVPHGKWVIDKPYCVSIKHYIDGILNGPFEIRERNHLMKGEYKNNILDKYVDHFDFENGEFKKNKTYFYKDGVLLQSFDYTIIPKTDSITVPIRIITPRVWRKKY